jgi:hypothetical protein
MWSRRRFIFVGIAGAIAASTVVLLPQFRAPGAAPNGAQLANEHDAMLRAVMTALLGSALPMDAKARESEFTRVNKAIGALVDNLPPMTRKEVGDLFGLLALKPARALLGYSGDWLNADPAVVGAFLEGLRDSSIGLKQQAYFALHDLVLGSFYSEPTTWAATGYPGPPKLV